VDRPTALPETARIYRRGWWQLAGDAAWAVERLYRQALFQYRAWFLASILAASVGLVVILWEVVQASNQPTLTVALKGASGLLTGAIGVLFYRRADVARKHAADLLSDIRSDHRDETALTVLGTIESTERRDKTAADLVKHLAGARAMRKRGGRPGGD
jgi:hypothetical protein